MLFTLPSRICAGASFAIRVGSYSFAFWPADTGMGLTWPSHRFSASFNSLV